MTTKSDVLKRALSCDRLDDLLAHIVNALGIPPGGANEEFTLRDPVTYTQLDGPHDRALFIESWLCAELRRAADRCSVT